MRVLVTGGSGYVGAAVVRALVAAGHKVMGIARTPEAQKTLAALNAHARPGDVALPASLARAADGMDALVHVASTHGPDRAEVDRAAIRALVEAARRSGGPRVVVYTSGCWTLGQGGGDEDTVCDHPAAASAHRPATEREVLAAADDNVATAVIRPAMVYGGKVGVAHWLLRHLPEAAGRPGTPTFVGDGQGRWSVVHRDDCARLYRLVVEKRARGVFHAAEETPLAVGEIARMFSRVGALPDPYAWPRAEAEKVIGASAEAFALDNPLSAPRAYALGWRPQHRFAAEVNQILKEVKGD